MQEGTKWTEKRPTERLYKNKNVLIIADVCRPATSQIALMIRNTMVMSEGDKTFPLSQIRENYNIFYFILYYFILFSPSPSFFFCPLFPCSPYISFLSSLSLSPSVFLSLSSSSHLCILFSLFILLIRILAASQR